MISRISIHTRQKHCCGIKANTIPNKTRKLLILLVLHDIGFYWKTLLEVIKLIQNCSKMHSTGYRKNINPNISTSDISRSLKFSYILKTNIIYEKSFKCLIIKLLEKVS